MSVCAAKVAPVSDTTYFHQVAAEVRAEMARQHKTASDLASVLGMKSSATARSRMKGESAFDAREIETVAGWLDVPLEALVLPPAVSA